MTKFSLRVSQNRASCTKNTEVRTFFVTSSFNWWSNRGIPKDNCRGNQISLWLTPLFLFILLLLLALSSKSTFSFIKSSSELVSVDCSLFNTVVETYGLVKRLFFKCFLDEMLINVT